MKGTSCLLQFGFLESQMFPTQIHKYFALSVSLDGNKTYSSFDLVCLNKKWNFRKKILEECLFILENIRGKRGSYVKLLSAVPAFFSFQVLFNFCDL